MDKQKILNHIKDGHRFLQMIEEKCPKARNQISSVGWVLNFIRDEVNKTDTPVVTVTPVEEVKKD